MPLLVVWDAHRLLRQATSIVSVARLRVYDVPSKHHIEAVYPDGSNLGDLPTKRSPLSSFYGRTLLLMGSGHALTITAPSCQVEGKNAQ